MAGDVHWHAPQVMLLHLPNEAKKKKEGGEDLITDCANLQSVRE